MAPDLPKLQALPHSQLTPSEQSLSSSNSPTNTRLTPNSDDEDGSDADLEDMQESGESYRMHSRPWGKQTSGDDVEEDEEEDFKRSTSTRRRGSASTIQSYQLYTPDEERAVVKKLDRRLVLFVALLYLLSFLDRSNIGNALIAGLAKDLAMTSNQIDWVISSFYIAYIAFEWLTLLWKIIPAHIYITVLVLSWGIVASLQSITTTYASLIVLRILLGVGEAGFTGIPFYLSFFFKREELALRTGLFISAAPLATSFASTLAWGIVKLGSYTPIAPWRLLFLLEGFPSVLVAVVAWRTIPDSPSTAHYLTRREKRIARLRLRKEKTPAEAQAGGLKKNEMLSTLKDPKAYLTAFMFFFANMAFSSMPVFLPTIIKDMGHTVVMSQALSAPPYLITFFVVIATAYISDRWQSRSYIICFHALLSAFGYTIMALAGYRNWNTWWRYAGVYPACIGFFSVITIIITWTINNQESESKQGTGFVMMQLIGQCGPILGTRLYPESDAPLFVTGSMGCAGAMLLVAILSISLRWYLKRLNGRANEKYEAVGEEEDTLVHKRSVSRPPFRYML